MPSHFTRKISAAQVDDARPDTPAFSPRVPRSRVTQRRILLQTAIKGALGAFVSSAAMEVLAPGSASAQTTLTPEMALAELVAGNKRFVREKLTSFQQNLSIIRNHTSEKQQPFAAVLI